MAVDLGRPLGGVLLTLRLTGLSVHVLLVDLPRSIHVSLQLLKLTRLVVLHVAAATVLSAPVLAMDSSRNLKTKAATMDLGDFPCLSIHH